MEAKFFNPIVTPVFNGHIDFEQAQKLLEYQIEKKIDGVVLMGSTGEFIGFDMAEKKQYFAFAINTLKGKCEILAGTGGMSPTETVELSNYALDAGADGVLVVSPFYYKLNEQTLEMYYDTIAEQIKGNVYLYNISVCTKHDITPELAKRLADKHANIVGYKDSTGDVSHTRKVICAVLPDHPEFRVFTGQEENFAHIAMSGGAGAIGGIANVVPDLCSAWSEAVRNKNFEGSAELQKKINKLVCMYDMPVHFITILKKAMNIRGITVREESSFITNEITADQEAIIRNVMEECEVI